MEAATGDKLPKSNPYDAKLHALLFAFSILTSIFLMPIKRIGDNI